MPYNNPTAIEKAFADPKALEALIKLDEAFASGIRWNGVGKQADIITLLTNAKLVFMTDPSGDSATFFISDLGKAELEKRRTNPTPAPAQSYKSHWQDSKENLTPLEHSFANPEIVKLLIALNEAHPKYITMSPHDCNSAEITIPQFANLIYLVPPDVFSRPASRPVKLFITKTGRKELKARGLIPPKPRKPKPLTEKQAKTLIFIATYINANNQSPTMDEIRAELKFQHRQSVEQILLKLKREGFIKTKRYVKRGIIVIKSATIPPYTTFAELTEIQKAAEWCWRRDLPPTAYTKTGKPIKNASQLLKFATEREAT